MDGFSQATHRATSFTGSWKALSLLGLATVAWLAAGWITDWNRPWELTVTTGAPILTLVLVVILQHAQNRNARAVHLKLNELLTALDEPDSEVLDAEERSDEHLAVLDQRHRQQLTDNKNN